MRIVRTCYVSCHFRRHVGAYVQQRCQMSLINTLEKTVVWLRFREYLKQSPLVEELKALWPEGTVPRQEEIGNLTSTVARLRRLVLRLMEHAARQGKLPPALVAQARGLGVEIPGSSLHTGDGNDRY